MPKADYGWCNGSTALCRCGKIGVWSWEWDADEFEVWHDVNDRCTFKTVTSREERALRIAKGRKKRY